MMQNAEPMTYKQNAAASISCSERPPFLGFC